MAEISIKRHSSDTGSRAVNVTVTYQNSSQNVITATIRVGESVTNLYTTSATAIVVKSVSAANGYKSTQVYYVVTGPQPSNKTISLNKSIPVPQGTSLVTIQPLISPISYSIKFDKNNNSATGSMSNLSMTYGTAKNLTLNDFELDGYSFMGWATSSDGGVIYTDGQSVSNLTATDGNTVTLYAVWEQQCTVTMGTSDHGTATVQGPGESSGSAIGTYGAGTSVTLTATPDTGYEFVRWDDSGTGYTDNPRTVTVNSDVTYTATFQKANYTITCAKYGDGNGTATVMGPGESSGSTSGTYEYGTTVTLTATPTNNSFFTQWNDGNTNASRQVEVTANATYTATFQPPKSISCSVQSGSGTITMEGGGLPSGSTSGVVPKGSTVTVTAIPGTGYHVYNVWASGYGNHYSSEPWVVTINDGTTFHAAFDPNQYTITCAKTGGDSGCTATVKASSSSGSGSTSGTFDYGTSVTLTATASQGYEFVQWNDGDTNNQRTVTVSGDTTYTATFQLQSYNLTLNVPTGCAAIYYKKEGDESYSSVSSTSIRRFPNQTKLLLYATAKDGYRVTSSSVDNQVVYIMPAQDASVTPEVEARTYTVTFNPNGDGASVSQSTKTVKFGSTYGPIPNPSRPSYDFTGWYTEGGSLVTSSTTVSIAEDHTLYASWRGVNYWVRFWPEGGTGTMEPQRMTYGTSATLTPNAFTRTGYAFKEWSTGGQNPVFYQDEAEVINLASTSTFVFLSAVWEPETHTVTLDNGDGTGGEESVVATYGSPMPHVTPPTPPSGSGYSFIGYWSGENGTGVKYYDKNGDSVKVSDFLDDTTTLYAYYSNTVQNITYVPNGGVFDPIPSDTFPIDTKTDLPVPTKENYVFVGWFTDSALTEYIPFIPDTQTQPLTVYAKWQTDEEVFGTGTVLTIEISDTEDGPYPFEFYRLTSSGYTNIDWGDGIVGYPENLNNEPVTHAYTRSGTYTIRISDTISIVRKSGSGSTHVDGNEYVTSISRFGNSVATIRFSHCVKLASVPEWNNITTNLEGYSGCTSLSQMPPWPDGHVSFDSTFVNATSLKSAQPFPENINGNLKYVFYGSGITALPKWTSSEINVTGIYFKCADVGTTFSYRTDILMPSNISCIEYSVTGVVNSDSSAFARSLFVSSWGGTRTSTSFGIDLECGVADTVLTARIAQKGSAATRDDTYDYTNPTQNGCVFEPGDTVEISVSSPYRFLGWKMVDESDDSDGDEELIPGTTIQLTPTGNVTYIAVFQFTRTIVYSANVSSYTGAAPASQTITRSDESIKISSNTFTSAHRMFLLWNTAADGTGKSFSPGDVVTFADFDDASSSTVMLYAQWQGEMCTLTLDANGGTIPAGENVESYEYGKGTSLPTPTRTGYRFIGWTDEHDGGTVYESISATQWGDLTLYAQWGAPVFTVTFKDGNGNVLSTQYIAMGGYATPPVAPTRKGYTFSGWDTDPTTTQIVEDTVFTAQYSARTYYIQVLVEGGTGIVNINEATSQGGNFDYGSEIELTVLPDTNYEFVRWEDGSTDNPRTLTVSQAATYVATLAGKAKIVSATSADPSMGTANGGGSYPYGSTASLSANPRPGCKFLYWNDMSEENPHVVQVPGDASYVAYVAYFANVEYTVTARSNESGFGTVSISSDNAPTQSGDSVSATAYYGVVLTLSATPASGCSFVRWSDGSTAATRTITVTENADFVAIFAQNAAAPTTATPPSPSHTTLARRTFTDRFGTSHVNDIYLVGGERDANGNLINPDGPLGNFAIVSGKEAYVQIVDAVVKTRLGELILDTERGIPYLEGAFLNSEGRARWASAMRQSVEELDFVTEINDFTWEVSNGTIIYSMTITTDDGTIQVSNA